MPKLCLASNNAHKVEEFRQILASTQIPWEILPIKDVAPGLTWDETGTTFEENAAIKAKALRKYTKEWILADDSGLCVPRLGGAPGVYSSSYGGTEGDSQKNNQRLLSEITTFQGHDLKAYFTCTLYLLSPADEVFIFTGELHGQLTTSPSGGLGFGYDPLFIPEGSNVTLAELTPEQKNQISHRGRAAKKLTDFLKVKMRSLK